VKVGEAKIIARTWVAEHITLVPGFQGAWFAGSVNALPDEAILPETSDLDVMVLLATSNPPVKPGKFRYRGVLIEISYVSLDEMRTPEQVLGHYHLAGSVRGGWIIADPQGHLARLQDAVSRDFTRRTWIECRCEHARDTVLARIGAVSETRPFEEQVMSWLFAAGGVPHILLVARLRNPTVRKRYIAVRDLLVASSRESVYGYMLALLDPLEMTADRAAYHLTVLGEAFDAAASVVATPFPFASDISPDARSLAIEGSRELIENGDHREAIFWVVATFARCQMVLHADAPIESARRWDSAFRELVADLGIRSFDDLQRRGEEIRAALPGVWAVAEEIMDQVSTD
jgi:hypothetical protein